MFCSLCRKFSLLSCSCFFRCCLRKQKSQVLSLLIFLRLHSPHTEEAQRRLGREGVPVVAIDPPLLVEGLLTDVAGVGVGEVLIGLYFYAGDIVDVGG